MIGINTFGLAKYIQADQRKTIQRLAEIGFSLVEPLLVPLDCQGDYPKVVLSRETLLPFLEDCASCGITAQTAHVFADATAPLEKTAAYLSWVHLNSSIDHFILSCSMASVQQAEQQAAYMSELTEMLSKENCRLLYHNHARELRVLSNGQTALDRFFAVCSPKVLLQLDVGWAGIAGDEEKIAAKFSQRIASLHFKDFVAETRLLYTEETMPNERLAAVGSGDIHSAEVLAMRDTFPQFGGTLIIDQDHSGGDIFEDVAAGLGWLRKAMET